MIKILFEDKNIVICEKLPGMECEDSESSDSLPKLLKEQLKCEIFVVHRLDKPTGGIILYAKNKKSAAAFSKLISENGIKKEYLAVLDAVPQKATDEFCDLLFKDSRKNKTFVVKRMRKGVKEAKLSFLLESSSDNKALIRVSLITGRSHQIRVQFASRKMPLTGDGKYGSRDNRCDTALWAEKLTFTHPFTKESVTAESEPPYDDYPWSIFKAE